MIILLLALLAQLIHTNAASAIDCKAIDSTQFKESFDFKYSGGPNGLKLNFAFDGNSDKKFFHEGCKFEIKMLKSTDYGANSYTRSPKHSNLNGLKPCTKYKVVLSIVNLASRKEFNYENVLATKPDKSVTIRLSVKEIAENSATLSWTTKNDRGCLVSYGVMVSDHKNVVVHDIKGIKGTSYVLEDLVDSKNFSAKVTGVDDKGSLVTSNVATITIMSNEVNDYDVDIDVFISAVYVDTNSVELNWNCSDKDLKDVEYHLTIHDSQGKSVFDKKTTSNSIVVSTLGPCNRYKASATLYGKTSSVEFTTKPLQPGSVTGINFKSNETFSMISWQHPEEYKDCVTNYTVMLAGSSDDSISYTWIVSKKKSSILVKNLPYAKKHVTVYINANWATFNANSSNISTSATNASLSSYPIHLGLVSNASNSFEHFSRSEFVVEHFNEFRLGVSELQVLWSFHQAFSDIFSEFIVTVDNKTSTTRNKFINFEIDACKNKTYTVTVTCISKAGSAGNTVSYRTNLNDDDVQLSAIDDTNIKVEQTDAAVTIAWTPNAREQSCIAHYEVDYLNNVSIYERPEMEIHKFSACVTYQVGITPVSKSGHRGVTKLYEFDTNVKVPPKPSAPTLTSRGNRHLKLAISFEEDFKRCVVMKQTVLEVVCNNRSAVNESITRIQTDYKIVVLNLKPITKYECHARVTNEMGTSENSDVAEFVTQQDSPQPPERVKIVSNDNNSINVEWTANNSTGIADYYNVHVNLLKPLYDIGEDCHKSFKNVTVNESLSEQATITDLLPYSIYRLKVIATNGFGKSNFSDEVQFTTRPTKPSQPRDIVVTLGNNDNARVSAEISWKPPCFMNGVLSFYTVSIDGHRKGLKNHKQTNTTSDPKLVVDNLKMGYNYDVEIQAVNQNNAFSDVLKHSFIAPSGIPLVEDLKDWTTLGDTQGKLSPDSIDVHMKRSVFISSVGDIKGIIFLIFARNCHDLPQPLFGYRKNLNTELPQAINGELNCTQLYQQTDFLHNPLNYDDEKERGDVDAYSTKFTLGEGKCGKHMFKQSKNCNGPLRPNENYGLIARVFTKDAFRDTEPVYFETKNNFYIALLNTGYAIPAVVFGCIAIAMLISMVTSVVCCWMTRRQKRREKEKEAAEAAESLFSFTSYCVVDKNPVPKNHFDPLL